jgi:hypothetical protein
LVEVSVKKLIRNVSASRSMRSSAGCFSELTNNRDNSEREDPPCSGYGEDKERSGVPQPPAPLHGAGSVVGLAAGREGPGERGAATSPSTKN